MSIRERLASVEHLVVPGRTEGDFLLCSSNRQIATLFARSQGCIMIVKTAVNPKDAKTVAVPCLSMRANYRMSFTGR
nr:hypothetical protein [uncultured Pseudoxanthomonas sp.]